MKIFTGTVISTKMAKTATVLVERVVSHPVYKKRYKTTKKYHVHDETGVEVGQRVRFVACKPYSKLKKWKIKEIVGQKEKKNKKTKKTAAKSKSESKK